MVLGVPGKCATPTIPKEWLHSQLLHEQDYCLPMWSIWTFHTWKGYKVFTFDVSQIPRCRKVCQRLWNQKVSLWSDYGPGIKTKRLFFHWRRIKKRSLFFKSIRRKIYEGQVGQDVRHFLTLPSLRRTCVAEQIACLLCAGVEVSGRIWMTAILG